MKLCDFDCAEAMFYFLSDNKEIYDDFCEKSIYSDLSIAEYVAQYKRGEFIIYAKEKFDIDID